jgi:hypothetical protein
VAIKYSGKMETTERMRKPFKTVGRKELVRHPWLKPGVNEKGELVFTEPHFLEHAKYSVKQGTL